MNPKILSNIIERPDLRERSRVFRDRAHAGEVVAEMLDAYCQSEAIYQRSSASSCHETLHIITFPFYRFSGTIDIFLSPKQKKGYQ